jgi:hypothetical protein
MLNRHPRTLLTRRALRTRSYYAQSTSGSHHILGGLNTGFRHHGFDWTLTILYNEQIE